MYIYLGQTGSNSQFGIPLMKKCCANLLAYTELTPSRQTPPEVLRGVCLFDNLHNSRKRAFYVTSPFMPKIYRTRSALTTFFRFLIFLFFAFRIPADWQHFFSGLCQFNSQVRTGRCLTNTAFLGADGCDCSHFICSFCCSIFCPLCERTSCAPFL